MRDALILNTEKAAAFRGRLRERRRELGLSLSDMGARMRNIDGDHSWDSWDGDRIRVWEKANGPETVHPSVAEAFVRSLEVTEAWLFGMPRRREAVLATREKYR